MQRTSNSARPLRILIVGAMMLSYCACSALNPQPTPQQRAQKIDPVLEAAGFKAMPADTPAKEQSLKALIPLKMKYYVNKKSEFQYWFADPYVCNCLYLGDAKAHQQYENLKLQQQIANEQKEAAEENLEASQDMEMDMMGPFGYGPGFGFAF